jgi:predicted ArsR family transcriptional regulator
MKDKFYEKAKEHVELAAYFARQMFEELGKDKAMEIIGRAYENYSGDTFSEPYRDVPLDQRFEKFKQSMRDKAAAEDYLKIVSESDKHIEVRFERCPYYEVYKDLGVPDVCQKYCDGDFTAFRRVHPKLKVERNHEIAYGDSFCDHRWVMED